MTLRVGIIFALTVFLLLYISVLRRDADISSVPLKSGSLLESLRVVQKEGDSSKWELLAERADLGKSMKAAELESLRLNIHQPSELSVSAKQGHYDFSTRNIEFLGDVAIKGKSWVLTTKKADWNDAAGFLTSEDPILMEGKTFSVKGIGLQVDVETQIAKTSEVTCTFYSR